MRRNKGFILMSVLLATTLLITSATAFAWFARSEATLAAKREDILKFRNVAEIAVITIGQRIAADTNGFDCIAEQLYLPGRPTKIEMGDYEISVEITPLNDRISAYGVLLPDGVTLRSEYEDAWYNMWNALELPELAATVLDFMDSDSSQTLGGAERVGNINRVISDLSELKGIPEINDGVLWGGTEDNPVGLCEYLSVYGDEMININVATPEVLMILDDDITSAVVRSIVARRVVNPFTAIEDLSDMPGFPADAATRLSNIISFESTCFQLNMSVVDSTRETTRNYKIVVERSNSFCHVLTWEE